VINEYKKGNIKPICVGMILPCFFYDAFAIGICAAFNIFSIKIPYPWWDR